MCWVWDLTDTSIVHFVFIIGFCVQLWWFKLKYQMYTDNIQTEVSYEWSGLYSVFSAVSIVPFLIFQPFASLLLANKWLTSVHVIMCRKLLNVWTLSFIIPKPCFLGCWERIYSYCNKAFCVLRPNYVDTVSILNFCYKNVQLLMDR